MKVAGLTTLGGVMLDVLGRKRPIVPARLGHPLGILVLLLALVTVVAALCHPTEESLRETVRFVTIVAFFFVTVHLVDTPARLRQALTAWIVVATGVAIYALLQRSFGATVGSEDWQPLAGTVIDVGEEEIGVMRRAAGPFTHPVWLALYLSTALPLTLVRCWTARRDALRLAWLTAAGVQIAAILATYSRMGYLAVVLGIALLLLRRRGGPLLLGLTLALALATAPLWPAALTLRIASIFEYTRSSSSITRIGQQLVGWWMFRDNWTTGVGPGNFERSVDQYADRVSDTLRIERIGAHNMYVQVLAELGAQGVVLIVLLLFVGWRSAERSRCRARDPAQMLLYEAMSVSIVVFAFSAVLVHATYQKEWWFLLALVAAGSWLARTNSAVPEPKTAGRARTAARRSPGWQAATAAAAWRSPR